MRRTIRLVRWVGVICLLPALMGCKSESREVCEHLRDLAEASIDGDIRSKDYTRCVKEAKALAREDANRFRENARCLLDAASLEEASACSS